MLVMYFTSSAAMINHSASIMAVVAFGLCPVHQYSMVTNGDVMMHSLEVGNKVFPGRNEHKVIT